jgi:hypothetical protein
MLVTMERILGNFHLSIEYLRNILATATIANSGTAHFAQFKKTLGFDLNSAKYIASLLA